MYPSNEVRDLRKSGRTSEAYSSARDLLKTHPDDRYLKSEFGWVIYARVKHIVGQVRSDESNARTTDAGEELRSLLREYARLKLPRPDLLFSLLVRTVLRMPSDIAFLPKFLKWAGLDSFRPEDYRQQTAKDGDKVFAPLIETVARKTAKLVCEGAGRDVELKEFALVLLDKATKEGQIKDLIWLQYRKALLLIELGRIHEARDELIPVVRKKRSEYWAWQALAKTEQARNADLALSLYAKSYLTCHQEQFSVKVLGSMANIATKLGKFDLARWAVDRAIGVRQSYGWKVPGPLSALTKAGWYTDATGLADAKDVLERCASPADELVYADCREYGNYLGSFLAKSGKRMAKVGYREGGGVAECVTLAKRLSELNEYPIGAPVTVGLLRDGDWPHIVELKPRPDGTPFDCLEESYGVVDHQNELKGLVSIYVTENEYSLLHYREFAFVRGWSAGNPVRIWFTRRGDRMTVYRAEPTAFQETGSIKRVTAPISVHPKGFGFVDDVFVPPPLALSTSQGAQVAVVAVRKPKGKSTEIGWAALTVEIVE